MEKMKKKFKFFGGSLDGDTLKLPVDTKNISVAYDYTGAEYDDCGLKIEFISIDHYFLNKLGSFVLDRREVKRSERKKN